MSNRLDAWIHWREQELKRNQLDEDAILFLNDIKELRQAVKGLRDGLKEAIEDDCMGISDPNEYGTFKHEKDCRLVAILAKYPEGEK